MKLKNLLTKTLLAAGMLCFGGGNSWADDYYNVTRYVQDYEDGTSYSTGWSFQSGYSQGIVGENHYLNMSVSGNNQQKTNTLDFSSNPYFTGAADYEFSFEYGYGSGNAYAKPSSLTVNDADGNALFTFANTDGGWGTSVKLSYGETEIGTYTAIYKTISNPFLKFTITANSSTGVLLTVDNNGSKIANAVKIADFKTIKSVVIVATGGASVFGIDNMTLKEHSDVAVAEDPTFTFKKVSDENRVYTITNPNGEGTLYYTTSTAAVAPAVGDAAYSSTTETSIDVPFGTGTFYAYAVLADGSTTSAIVSQEVTGGAIKLVTPYYTIVSYDEGTAKTTVTLNTKVSGLLGTPTATIKYIIDGGAEQETTNGGTVLVADGSSIEFYAEAEGYTTSDHVSATATAPNGNPELWTETYKGKVSSDKGFTLGTVVIATENTTNYYYLYYDETIQLSEKLLANGVYSNNMIRSNGYYSGQNASLAINGLKEGDYVIFKGAYGNGAFVINANSSDFEADAWHTINGSQYCYTVKRNCSGRFSLDRYGYLQSITVQRALENRGATVGSTGYATFAADVALDLSTLTSGFTAYFASASADGKVTMTKATNEKIAAGEGLLIQGSGDFTITETREATADVTNYLVAGDGVTDGIAKEDGFDKYVLGADGETVSFFLINTTPATIATNKAYLKIPNGGGSARLAIVFDGDETTGINNVNVNHNDDWYDLQGRRVATPQKGLYIVNGKKVMVK